MPRAPHSMPLLLLLLLSLPHTQAAFPQDPIPLLTSDLQGKCPTHFTFLGGMQVENETPMLERQGVGMFPVLRKLREWSGHGEQASGMSWSHACLLPALCLHSEVVLLGG